MDLHKKKPMVIKQDRIPNVLRTVCNRTAPAKIASEILKFSAAFLDFDETSLIMDNRLVHLNDVRQLRNTVLTLYFPFRKTLLKGEIRLVGLTTFKGIRALRFTLPTQLVTDEKRGVKRLKYLPGESGITFHTSELRIYHGRIHDISPTGMAVILDQVTDMDQVQLRKGKNYQADAILGGELKLSMRLELCYVNELDKSTMAGTMQCGFRIHGLLGKTQVRLNEWLFKCNIHEVEAENLKLRQERQAALPSRRNANSILVVGPKDIDLDYWYQCLGRKFEVITSDANIANIRDSLNTGPGLVLMYLDPKDPAKASFTRKFCSTLGNRFPIMFFGEESDRARQQTLMGQIPNHGFLDTNERKLLLKFRQVDEVMARLAE